MGGDLTIMGENDKGPGLLQTPLSNKVCVVCGMFKNYSISEGRSSLWPCRRMS